MNTAAIGGGAGSSVANPRGIKSLKSEDFFRILVTELQQQDPLEPSKTADMISQVSQIRDIEISSQLGETLDSLVRNQRAAGASDFIGKYITAAVRGDDGVEQPIEGVVTGVRFAADGPAVLELDNGLTVGISDVQQVMTPQEAERRQAALPQSAGPAEPAAAKGLLPTARPRERGLLDWLRL